MKKNITALFLVFLMGAFLGSSICPEQKTITTKGNLKVLVLEGSPYERGRQHGTALKQEIHSLVKLWKEDIERTYKTEAELFLTTFLAATNFQKAIKKWTPDLWEELKGISDGSGVDFDTMFAFQLVDEIWVLGREIQAEKCTTIGLDKSTKHPAIVAQNLDIPSFYHGFQTLLHIMDPAREMETFLFTFPGFIAANGINSFSVAVVVNAVQQLGNSRDGLPVAFVIRGILQRRSYADAVRFIKTVKHGAPQNYMIGGAEEMGSYECSTTHVNRFIPFENAAFTYHTNHPVSNLHYRAGFAEYLESRGVSPKDYRHPCPRFEALQNIFTDNSIQGDVNMLKSIFSDRKTIVNNQGTFGCTIMKLGKSPELHISPGRPDEEPFYVFRFVDL